MAIETATMTPLLSFEDYLCLEEQSTVKHEYVAGEVFALAGAAERHNLIVSNILGHLWTAARRDPCRVYTSDMKIRAAKDLSYYADVSVVCDPEDVEEMYKSRPCVVVEVLSPRTEDIDRREKMRAYRQIDSLRAYIMVHRDRRHVIGYWRDEHDTWLLAEISGEGKVPFPCPEVTLSLDEIYEGLPEPARA